MTSCRRIYGCILISLIIMEVIGVMVLVPGFMVYASDDDTYLVNTDNSKVLRVPYLHQDYVDHCWLYSVGMVIAYYGKEFNPDLILNRTGKGFNVGLYLIEFNRLSRVTKDLYGIEFSYTNVQSKDSLKNIVLNEISNGKPVLLFMKRHMVVVTGYRKNVTTFYLVVNDPSGYLTHIVWKTNTRFDGSIAYKHNAYGVLVDIDVVFDSLNSSESIIVITVKSALTKPNPPKAVVHAYTIPPNASTDIYDSFKKVLMNNYTRFYHNNYLDRSLWYPLPAVALGSPIYINMYVYPNTKHQEELYLDIEVVHKDFHGLVTTINDRVIVKINNLSHAEIIIPNITKFNYTKPIPFSMVRAAIPTWSVGNLQIKLKLYEKYTNNIVYVWGPIDVYVYHELAYLSIDRLLTRINVVAGILYGVLPNNKYIDLYVSFWQPSILGIPIVNSIFWLIRPCSTVFSLPQPNPSLGGYYYVCSVKIPQDKDSIDIVGVISIGLLNIPIKETLVLPSAGITRFTQLNLQDVVFSVNGTVVFNINYCIPRTVFQKYKIVISLNNYSRYAVDLGIANCGNVVAKVSGAPITSPNVNVSIELLDELGNIVNTKFYTILNPLTISVSDLATPTDITSDSHTFIRYNISIPKKAVQNLYSLSMSALIYINGSELASSTWVEGVAEDGDSYTMLMRSDMYAPHCENDTVCTYILTVVPKVGIRYSVQETVYVYSYDVRREHIIKVYSRPMELKRTAIFIVIDVSGSMDSTFKYRTKLDWAKEAAIYLINMTFDGDYLGVIAFSSWPTIIQDVVEVNKTTREILIKEILRLIAGGSTNIGDSLKLATDLLNKHELLRYKRVIVLLTDGMHNIGTHPRDVLNYVKESGVVVYTIGLGEPGDIDEDVLNIIAYETGGKYYYAPTPDKLQEIFTHIRGEALALNLIDRDVAKLGPYEELWSIYPMDLSYSDFVVEISWDKGSEPMVILRFLNITVTQGNASTIGIQVSYPAINTVRFTIPKQYNYTYLYLASASPYVLPINISIVNINPHDTTIKKSIFGGKEVLLEVIIDNPTARYSQGQYLYYRIVAEKNKKVQVALTDVDGNVLYLNTLIITETTGVHSGTLNHYLKLPEKPGEYYLKVSLFDIFLLKTKVIPITIVDSQYQNPISISHIDKVEGFGLIQIPINITVTDPNILGKTLTIQTELQPQLPYTPFVVVNPQIIKMTNYNQNVYIYIDVPYDVIPGEYNLSLILVIEGHSVIVKKNAIKLYIPTIKIVVEGIRDVVYLHQGSKADLNVHLNIISSKRYGVGVGLRSLFNDQIVSIEGLPTYRTFVYTNSTINITVEYNTNNVGVYSGVIEVSVNGTPINNLKQVLVVLPREADLNKTIWIHGYNTIILGPDNSKNIGIQLKIDWKSYVAGIISVPTKLRSEVDYIVYAYSREGKASPLLTIYIPQKFRQQGYTLFIEKDYSTVDSIPITPQTDSLNVYIETGCIYRIWVGVTPTPSPTPSTTTTPTPHTPTPSPTQTPTPTPTYTQTPTQTQTTLVIIGGLPVATTSITMPSTITTTPSRLPILITVIIIILIIEIEIIVIIYLKKRRY